MADRRRDVDRFGRWASSYDRSYLQPLLLEPVHRATLAALTCERARPARVLDVGCGTGRLLHRAAGVFPAAELVGVDPAAEMVREAEASLPSDVHARFLHGAAEALPFADASFDVVVSSMSFHRWADQKAGLREVRRVLAGGRLFALAEGFAVGALLRFGFWAAGKRGRVHPGRVGRDARRATTDDDRSRGRAADERQRSRRGQPGGRRRLSVAEPRNEAGRARAPRRAADRRSARLRTWNGRSSRSGGPISRSSRSSEPASRQPAPRSTPSAPRAPRG